MGVRPEPVWSLAVHGGAGVGRAREAGKAPDLGAERETETEREDAIRAALTRVLEAGALMLAAGRTSLDAVEDAVRQLEDSPLFNAGRGAVFNERGEHELEASIMDGRTLDAGAVAVLEGIENPVSLARLVMERSPHVFLQGEGALAFAAAHGIERVEPGYFATELRRRALDDARRRGGDRSGSAAPPLPELDTVGAVALDVHGNLAAATSTGGLTNKAVGRVGDSAVIGAGCYASNASCAVSCTGQGEYFIRATVARDVAAMIEYGGVDLGTAARRVVAERLAKLGGEGGVIAVDRRGDVVFAFNTNVMLRGAVTDATRPWVGIYEERREGRRQPRGR